MDDQPPELPQRSALRIPTALNTARLAKLDTSPATLGRSTPHDFYLSSEEEASSSADDSSDYGFEGSEDEEDRGQSASLREVSQSPRPRRRRSHEDTARMVSVVYSGRPSIVQVSSPRRPRTSSGSSPGSSRNIARGPASASSLAQAMPHPPRSSSMMLPPTNKLMKHRPQFLNIDPFPNKATPEPRGPIRFGEDEIPRTPRTPSAVFKSVTRSLSLSKKRSRPGLATNGHASYQQHPSSSSSAGVMSNPAANSSCTSLPLERSQTPQSHSGIPEDPASPPSSEDFQLHSEPVSRRLSQYAALPPPPPLPRSQISPMKGILAMARRRSIHRGASAV